MKGLDTAGALAPGERYDRYQIASLLAQGGRSFVYTALDTATDRLTALQVFVGRLDDKQRARIDDVRERLVQLHHPSIVRTAGIGMTDGRLWFATELVRGRSLEAELRARGPLPMREVAGIGAQIARGLDAAHALKLIHRSIKPANVLLVEDMATPTVKVLDTGLWTILYGGNGGTLATPQMMAPEECDGPNADARSDVYSLGVLLFQLLTGRVPFEAPTLNELKDAHLHREPPRLRALKPAAEPMEAIVNRALLKRANDRFQSMAAFASALDEILAAPLGALVLSTDDAARPEPTKGGTWQVVAAHESRTLVESEQRPIFALPPEPTAPARSPKRDTPSSSRRTRTPSQVRQNRGLDRRSLIAWIVAALVVAAWVIVGIIAWSRQ